MIAETSWIANGRTVKVITGEIGSRDEEDALIQRSGYVRLVTSPEATEVKWAIFAPN